MTATLEKEVTAPQPPLDGDVADRRSKFRKLTAETPRDPSAERAFLASKLAVLQSHPKLSAATRYEGEQTLAEAAGLADSAQLAAAVAPPPGGVGYGMFYTNSFRTRFARGTAFYYEIVCPHQPGGNVADYLYLTATNRAQKGVEAFVSYHAQDIARFKVFDWARSDHWQTDIPFANLTSYLRSTSSHGWGLQTLLVWNQSFEIAPNRWRNEVLLHNRAANRWDLVYRFDYQSSTAEQTSGWVGSWGPIVETFQNSYTNTRWLGFLNTMLVGRDAAGNWGQWALLRAADSTVRNDGHGFSPLFLDPNYSFVVKS
ncbi:Uncharacterised protein [Mycobacteroides abscessus subsp. abscessus]|uniref:Uncharacterized protein n=18 Tax=Mycobacteroides abscessus TaxID=36809 RepID=B1MCW7_MYCA9|nr:hypothetical protein [Mycobacteroides abscessus]ESV59395.1 hypothetical protein L830_1609 [Mycobacteroides abscessus MAB_082312_2258]ESV64204.1 hypothetical protein L833_1588 [Mycobacteroides abscessus MAB_091912_2446]EUA61625.1 hypothetical protein I542_1768 [Mycobacteroides abscessus 1948]AIC71881.1 hypothetical protein MYCMA_07440 [Mycobacteroides abscessus subsp. massiliense str. GO 06]ALM17192.1 hypothetical protein AOY11_13975 [Mycobacteroides abscessus]